MRGERRYRLTGVGAFDAVFRAGARRDGALVQLIAMPAQREPGRAGFAIGRRELPRAVDRNYLKRRLRAMLRSRRAAAMRFDLIVRLRRPLAPHELAAAAAEAERLFAVLTEPGLRP